MKNTLTIANAICLLIAFQSSAIAQPGNGPGPNSSPNMGKPKELHNPRPPVAASRFDRSRYYPVRVRDRDYFYRNGLFYRHNHNRYVVIDPPIGARVGFLPGSAISVLIGPHRYFRVGLTWYLYDHDHDHYEVVEAPEEVHDNDESTYAEQNPDLIFYPADGQSEEQTDKDRYECYRWAKDQSGFDPTMANQDMSRKDMYQRAMSACMEARDYTVR